MAGLLAAWCVPPAKWVDLRLGGLLGSSLRLLPAVIISLPPSTLLTLASFRLLVFHDALSLAGSGHLKNMLPTYRSNR